MAGGDSSRRVIILNADGVYLAAYCTLHLGLRQCMDGAYGEPGDGDGGGGRDYRDPADRQRFVDSILSSGLLVYASPAWLAEAFDTVAEVDALGLSLRDRGKLSGLRSLLADLEGFGETHRGAQMLCDFKRFRQDVGRVTAAADHGSASGKIRSREKKWSLS